VLFKFKIVVKDDERAFLIRDGRIERLLGPGRFVALDYGRASLRTPLRSRVPRLPPARRSCSPRRIRRAVGGTKWHSSMRRSRMRSRSAASSW